VEKYVLNKQGKFGLKIFLRYTDIAIFALRHFILPHPVDAARRQNSSGSSTTAASDSRCSSQILHVCIVYTGSASDGPKDSSLLSTCITLCPTKNN